MKKKIIIGSIIGAVILILVSFTSVIGYTNVESNVKNSPLFNIRANRAIGKQNRFLTCKYVSKGIKLLIPKRDDQAVITKKIIDSIQKMDDKTFETLITYLINIARKEKMFNGIINEKIREALYLIRHSKEPIQNFNNIRNKYNNQLETALATVCCRTEGQGGCPYTIEGAETLLGCLLVLLAIPLMFILWCFNAVGNGGGTISIICATRQTNCGGCHLPKTLRKLK